MLEFVVGLAVGLVVGWNFLKQPTVVSEWVEKAKSKLDL
jgi:hypothetical protein